MLEELSAKEKVSGLKQTRRAVAAGRAARVYLACDADPRLTEPLRALCEQSGVETAEQYSMAQLGRACPHSGGHRGRGTAGGQNVISSE